MGHAYVVCASEYGGPSDPSSGTKGYKGDDLRGKPAFAELYMGNALGNLPYRTKLRISYRPQASSEQQPRSIVGEKLDIGLGGAPCSGHARRIDLWYQLAQALNFSGTGLVVIERVDGKPISGPNDTNVAAQGFGGKMTNTTVGAGVLGTGIGPNTEKEGNEASENFKGAVEGAVSWTKDLGKILGFLGSSGGWLRIGKVVLGAGLLLIAIDELSKIGPGPDTNVSAAPSKAAGVAKAAVTKNPLELL